MSERSAARIGKYVDLPGALLTKEQKFVLSEIHDTETMSGVVVYGYDMVFEIDGTSYDGGRDFDKKEYYLWVRDSSGSMRKAYRDGSFD